MLTILIATDEPLTRRGLAEDLSTIDGVRVVGEADTEETTLERIGSLHPNLVFLDLQLIAAGGNSMAQLVSRSGGPSFVFLTPFEWDIHVSDRRNFSYLPKPVSMERLRKVIDKARMPELAAKPSGGSAPTGTLDRIGQGVSLLCAIHCALTPLATGILSVLGAGWLVSQRFEWSLVALSTLIGASTLLPGYRRHRQRRSLALFFAGLSLILMVRILTFEAVAVEVPAVLIGAALIISAHALNRRLCNSCPTCHDSSPLAARNSLSP